MSAIERLEQFSSFRGAAERAQTLAYFCQADIAIRSRRGGWELIAPIGSPPAHVDEDLEADDSLPDEQDREQDQIDAERQEEMFDELSSGEDEWERSNEEGWMYGDDDDGY